MKFYSNFLALIALQGAAAFSVQSPSGRTSSALFAGFEDTQRLLGDSKFGAASLRNQFDKKSSIRIEGQTLRTCSLAESADKVLLVMKTDGRPLEAQCELWQGPDYTPIEATVYIEDGKLRPLNILFETPGAGNSISIRNTAQSEFPLDACMKLDDAKTGLTTFTKALGDIAEKKTFAERRVQGGAVKTYNLEPDVESVQIMLKSETYGDKLKATIELLQGPNNLKQTISVYGSDGKKRPFYAVLETPGTGNVVRIINTATVEFPLSVAVEPYTRNKASAFDSTSGSTGGMSWK